MARPFALTPVKPVRLSEAQVARQIKDFLAIRGYVIIRCHVGTFVPLRVAKNAVSLAKMGKYADAEQFLSRNVISACDEGTSDLLAVHPELPPIWIETKRPGGKLRPAQRLWLEYMNGCCGFHAGYWDSINSFINFYREKIDRR